MREDQQSDRPGPSIERFRDGWVLVDGDGVIQTPRPMPTARARAYAGLLGIDLPDRGPLRPHPALPLRGCR